MNKKAFQKLLIKCLRASTTGIRYLICQSVKKTSVPYFTVKNYENYILIVPIRRTESCFLPLVCSHYDTVRHVEEIEVVIEGDRTMDLGARQVQRLRDQRHGLRVDIAELVLEGVQHRQRGAFEMREPRDDRTGAVLVPGGISGHGSSPAQFAGRISSEMTARLERFQIVCSDRMIVISY